MTERSLELGAEQPSPEANPVATALVATVALASAGLLVAGGGASPLLAFAPLLLLAGAYALWRLPLRYTLLLLLALTLTADIPGERPGNPAWRSPLGPIGAVLYDNLNKATGIEALRFAGIEALFVAVLLVVLARVILAQRVDSEGRQPAASALTWSLGLAFCMVMLLEVWGIVRGGDFRQSLWQFRQMLWLPILTALFGYSLRGPRDFAPIGRVVAVAGCVKVAIGLYFLLAIARPQGVDPAHVTSHHDSTLFVTVIAMCVAAWVHRPTRRRLVLGAMISGWILIGLVINNRRIAFVSLFASLALLYTLLRGPVKRAATRAILLSIPVLLLYVAAGRFKTTGVFAPAAKILSVVQQKDASSATRDIENYNLLFTLKQNMLLGSGWGHEYIELTQAYDISHAFAQYRFIAHNSVLWLWTIGGLVGFTALWLPTSVGIFLAARSYRFARTPHERTAAASALAVMVAYIIQAWGDMGTQGWIGTFLIAAALAVSGKLATATGAWPSHLRVATWSRRPALAVDALLVVSALPVTAASSYLAALALVARHPRAPEDPPAGASHVTFDIVVPAHDEERGIGGTVASLLDLDYPRSAYRVVVVADNCTDHTADRAREAGATVLERRDAARRGKGFALAHAFEASLADGVADAVVVIDADSVVSPNLLAAFAARLRRGEDAVQAEYGVRNPASSWRTRLMVIAFTLFHTLRSLARERLRLSSGLRGNGMCFRTSLLRRVPHRAFSIVEDVEYGIALGLAGVRVAHAGEAHVLGDMPATARASRSQRERWEGGRWALVRRHVPALLAAALRRRDPVPLDLAADLLVPPLAPLGVASVAGTVTSLLAFTRGAAGPVGLALWGASLVGLLVYLVRGCALSGVGARAALDLMWAPVYALWKLTLLVRPKRQPGWVRTSRSSEP